MQANDLNDIRARLLMITGLAKSIEMLLANHGCTERLVPYLDHCTDSMCRELGRLNFVLALSTPEKNDAARVCGG
jgi:hypothetical protein